MLGPTLPTRETWPRATGSCQSDKQVLLLWAELARGVRNPKCSFNAVPASLGGCPGLNTIGLSRPYGGCDIPLYELAQTYSRFCPLSSDASFLSLSVAINFHAQVPKDGGKMGPGLGGLVKKLLHVYVWLPPQGLGEVRNGAVQFSPHDPKCISCF